MDEPEYRAKWMSRDELADAVRNMPVRHESLPPELMPRIKATFDSVGRYIRPNLEQWELGFMKDTHPEREVAIIELIADALCLYCQQNGEPTEGDKVKLVRALCTISTGNDPVGVASPVRRKLRDCWKTVNNPNR